MAVFTVGDAGQTDQVDFPLQSREPFDRVRLLRDQGVDTLICGGMQAFYEDLLRANGFEVISWVSGLVEDLLLAHLDGSLASGDELPYDTEPDFLSMDKMMER
jgi:predicted Fe-Mo cluster-binding NifX family protein